MTTKEQPSAGGIYEGVVCFIEENLIKDGLDLEIRMSDFYEATGLSEEETLDQMTYQSILEVRNLEGAETTFVLSVHGRDLMKQDTMCEMFAEHEKRNAERKGIGYVLRRERLSFKGKNHRRPSLASYEGDLGGYGVHPADEV